MSEKEEEAAEGGKSSLKKMIMIGVGALLLVGGSVGGTLFLTGGKEAPVDEELAGGSTAGELPPLVEIEELAAAMPKGPLPVFYYSMQPEFLVNIGTTSRGRQSFLMVELTVATVDEGSHEALLDHDPQLRNELLTLFSEQNPVVLQTAEGKVALREQARDIIDAVVTRRYGAERIKDVFLTRFVVQ